MTFEKRLQYNNSVPNAVHTNVGLIGRQVTVITHVATDVVATSNAHRYLETYQLICSTLRKFNACNEALLVIQTIRNLSLAGSAMDRLFFFN